MADLIDTLRSHNLSTAAWLMPRVRTAKIRSFHNGLVTTVNRIAAILLNGLDSIDRLGPNRTLTVPLNAALRPTIADFRCSRKISERRTHRLRDLDEAAAAAMALVAGVLR